MSRAGRAPLHRANAGLAGVHFILCDSLFNVSIVFNKVHVQQTGNVIVVSWPIAYLWNSRQHTRCSSNKRSSYSSSKQAFADLLSIDYRSTSSSLLMLSE